MEGGSFCEQNMLMRVPAGVFLCLLIGAIRNVNCLETKEGDGPSFHLNDFQNVIYIAKSNALELNCTVNTTLEKTSSEHFLAWQHNNTWIPSYFTCKIDNNTLQLRKNHIQFGDAGIFVCGMFSNTSKLPINTLHQVKVIVGVKPKRISEETVELVDNYGLPRPQVLSVQWRAQEVNVTYELFVSMHYDSSIWSCVYDSPVYCKKIPKSPDETLSCVVGKDILNNHDIPCKHKGVRCDIFCAKVISKNQFGTVETSKHWNLNHHEKCPPLENVAAVSTGDTFTLTWDRPRLVRSDIRLEYQISYNYTRVLTGQGIQYNKVVRDNTSFSDSVVPYARYIFQITCRMAADQDTKGPPVITEVRSEEGVPSEAPTRCRANNRLPHHVTIGFKVPPVNTWNGIPREFRVSYGNTTKRVKTSLKKLQEGSNGTDSQEIIVNNLVPNRNYTVKVAICTAVDCRWASNEPLCIINSIPNEDVNTKVTKKPDPSSSTYNKLKVVAIIFGIIGGLGLACVFISYLLKKKRVRTRKNSLWTSVGPLFLNGHCGIYEYMSNETVNSTGDSELYDNINVPRQGIDFGVGHLPVSRI